MGNRLDFTRLIIIGNFWNDIENENVENPIGNNKYSGKSELDSPRKSNKQNLNETNSDNIIEVWL